MAGVVTIPDAAERQTIRNLYALHGGNISAVSRATGRDRATVRKVLSEGEGESEITDTLQMTPDLIEALRRLGSGIAPQQTGMPVEPQQTGMPAEVQQTGIEKPKNPRLIHAEKHYGKMVGLFDIHMPYHDQANIDAARSFIEDWKPDLVVLGGDLFDFYGLSRFSKDPSRRFRIQEEFDVARPFVKWLDGIGCDVIYILGNHEDRLRRTVNDTPGLDGLRALEFARMADLPERWMVYPDGSQVRTGSLLWIHGDLKGCGGGIHVASNILRRLKTSFICGHWHRSQVFYEPGYDRTVRAGFSSGHLCDESQADYIDAPLWVPGFVSVDMAECGLFEVTQHTIHGGRFRHGGKTYAA